MARKRRKPARRDEATRDRRDREAREIARLREENERLRKQLEEQAKRIADLERQLALKQQNSTVTSKPPSSDGLSGHQRTRGRRVKSRRKAGGQLGHPGHHRELVPIERVDAIVNLTPEACGRCTRRLHPRHTIGEPRRHQVTELPQIAAHITEYRCHRRQCPQCGAITLAPLPDEHAHQFGPQLTALIAYLTVVCRMPRLVVQRFLEGALQIPISLGSTQNVWEETSAAVAAAYAELEAALPQEPVVNADETGHRTNGDKRWLWTFVARTFVLYRIAASRGSDVLQTVLGDAFAGILGSDRLPAYLKYVVGQRQFCWAHLTRNALSALDLARTPAAKRFCREALALDRRLFRLWHRFRGDPGVRGSPLTHAEHEDGVEPTNNAAERALRTAVQWRKIMFGTRSEQGERAVKRLLTIVRTCQLQQLSTLAYLTAAITAHRRCQPVPSLLKRRHTREPPASHKRQDRIVNRHD